MLVAFCFVVVIVCLLVWGQRVPWRANHARAKKNNLKQQKADSRGAKKETMIIKVSKSGQHS